MRFGEASRAGSAIMLFIADEKKKEYSLSWRGDCQALYVDEKSQLYNLNLGHRAIGGLSIEVGRFLGATAQEPHYAINKSRETQRANITDVKPTKMVLMTDGTFHCWERKKEFVFPLTDSEEEWIKKV